METCRLGILDLSQVVMARFPLVVACKLLSPVEGGWARCSYRRISALQSPR
jgi:hypothetical protein